MGVRWLLRRLSIYPNAYYNYRKHRKADYYTQKQAILTEIEHIYHDNNGVAGYRSMRAYLARKKISLSSLTVHRYMNKELGLKSIVRRKKPDYHYGKPHRKFDNLLQQDFTSVKPNQKWATDFTYLFLTGGDIRYNCTIIDLYDRSVVASITDRHITSDLAIRTLDKALNSQKSVSPELILHSDQGPQYTSKAFTEYCEACGVTQSMSKAGYPYDNAPMERYFNTLKNEEINLHNYYTEDSLYEAVEAFAYVTYNHILINENEIIVLTIESQTALRDLLGDIWKQTNGIEGGWIFSEAEKEIKIAKECELIANPFAIDINDKKILASLYKEIISVSEGNVIEMMGTLQGNLINMLDTMCEMVPYPIVYNDDFAYEGLFKLVDMKLDPEYEDSLQYLLDYVKASEEAPHAAEASVEQVISVPEEKSLFFI